MSATMTEKSLVSIAFLIESLCATFSMPILMWQQNAQMCHNMSKLP